MIIVVVLAILLAVIIVNVSWREFSSSPSASIKSTAVFAYFTGFFFFLYFFCDLAPDVIRYLKSYIFQTWQCFNGLTSRGSMLKKKKRSEARGLGARDCFFGVWSFTVAFAQCTVRIPEFFERIEQGMLETCLSMSFCMFYQDDRRIVGYFL